MLFAITVLFIIGYLAIALEHPLRIDKTATALLLGMTLWVLYAFGAETIVPAVSGEELKEFIAASSASLQQESLARQCLEFILNVKIIEHMGDISSTLFFLVGAMTIVELIDVHGGFSIITDRISTRQKRKLLWIICIIAFFLSAVLDNLTTTIVMIMLLRKLVNDQRERWIYASMVVIAANTGGAWSPIGDVTTIMLWVKGNVTTTALITYVLLPSIVALQSHRRVTRGKPHRYPQRFHLTPGKENDFLPRCRRTHLRSHIQIHHASPTLYRDSLRAEFVVDFH